MFLSATKSAFSLSRVAARFISTTSANLNQQAVTPDTNELEDLFFSNGNENSSLESANEMHGNVNTQTQRKKYSVGINRVELLGGVAADPDFLVSKRGDNFSSFRLFTNVDYRRRDGNFSEQIEIHDIHVFSTGLIAYLKKNVKKGSRVYVSGRLHYITRSDGSRKTLIRAELIQSIAKPVLNQD